MKPIPVTHRDLLDAEVATFSTVGPDGYPQMTVVWFLADEHGTIRISLNRARQKVKNLRRNPQCAMLILDLANPARYLEIRGDAEIAEDPDYAFADLVGAKYGGVDLRLTDAPDDRRVVVTLRPVKINAVDMGAARAEAGT